MDQADHVSFHIEPGDQPKPVAHEEPIRVVVCWLSLSGYSAACWRALAATRGIELLVLTFTNTQDEDAGWFSDSLAHGARCRLLSPVQRKDERFIEQIVAEFRPHAIFLPGWLHKPYSELAYSPRLQNCKFILSLDNQWKGTLKQRLARMKIGGLIDRVHALLVAGERAWQFACRLAGGENKVYRGGYGFDMSLFKDVYERRLCAGPWPRKFLFVGRYVPVKGFDILLPAYQQYRSMVSEPWTLSCAGDGPLVELFDGAPGTENLGWIQPPDLPPVLQSAGVFVLASWYEPWGVALAEAMGSGLPAICSEEVGAQVDMVRQCYTGLTVPTRDAARLAWAMKWMHDNYDRLPEMGKHAREFAKAYTAELWAERLTMVVKRIIGKS